MAAIRGLDAKLGGHLDFGDGSAIERRSLARLRVGLSMLGRRIPALAPLVRPIELEERALAAVLADPVLRDAFERDLADTTSGCRHPATALGRYLRTVDLSAYGPCQRLADPPRLAWPAYGTGWVWTSIEETTGPVAARLWELLRGVLPGPVRPSEQDLVALRRGAAVLAELLPAVGGTVLGHVRMVVLGHHAADDAARDGCPGTAFIAPERLRSPWDTACAILREGLRLTFLEIVRCGPALVDEPECDGVHSPAGRALFDLYACVHVALFRAAVQVAVQTGGPAPGRPSSVEESPLVNPDRLAELLERVRAHHLTPYGQTFLRWLAAPIEHLAPGVQAASQPADQMPSPAPRWPLQARFHVNQPADVVELADQQRLLVATGRPAKLHWLDVPSWLLYTLCDGQDLLQVTAAYLDAIGPAADPERVHHWVALELHRLVERGLITVEAMDAPYGAGSAHGSRSGSGVVRLDRSPRNTRSKRHPA
jgi:hypothetical protein